MQLIEQMTDAVSNRLNARLLRELPEADKKELDKVLDADGDMEVFFRSKLRNFDDITAEVIAGFKKETLDLHRVVRDARARTSR